MNTEKENKLLYYFLLPLAVTVIGGVVLLILTPIFSGFFPALKSAAEVIVTPASMTAQVARDPELAYSWNYHYYGTSRKWDLLVYSDLPAFECKFKLAVIGDKPSPVRIYLPTAGRIVDQTIPPGIKADLSKNDSCITLSLTPGTPNDIIPITLYIRLDQFGEPFSDDMIGITGMKAKKVSWDTFNDEIKSFSP